MCWVGVLRVNTQEWCSWVKQKICFLWETSLLTSTVAEPVYNSHQQCNRIFVCIPDSSGTCFLNDCHSVLGPCGSNIIPCYSFRTFPQLLPLYFLCFQPLLFCWLCSLPNANPSLHIPHENAFGNLNPPSTSNLSLILFRGKTHPSHAPVIDVYIHLYCSQPHHFRFLRLVLTRGFTWDVLVKVNMQQGSFWPLPWCFPGLWLEIASSFEVETTGFLLGWDSSPSVQLAHL